VKYRTVWLSSLLLAVASLTEAQSPAVSRVLRQGDQATLTVFDPRPVDAAAALLAKEFGIQINVEDPVYRSRADVQDIGPSRMASAGGRLLIPKAVLLETRFDLRPDGSVLDVQRLLHDLVETANAQSPWAYRIDGDDDVFTLVATGTRDDGERVIDVTPILDRHVDIPLGTRRVFEHVNLLIHALEVQTGIRISWLPGAVVGGIPWGTTVVSFEARDEPARRALLRLIRHEPGRFQWLMRCQPGQSWCFINLLPVTQKG